MHHYQASNRESEGVNSSNTHQSRWDGKSDKRKNDRDPISFSIVKTPKKLDWSMNRFKPAFQLQHPTPRSVVLRTADQSEPLAPNTTSFFQAHANPLEISRDERTPPIPNGNGIDKKSQPIDSDHAKDLSKIIENQRKEITKLKSTLSQSIDDNRKKDVTVDKQHKYEYSKLHSEKNNLEKKYKKAVEEVNSMREVRTILVDEKLIEHQQQLDNLKAINEQILNQVNILTQENTNYVLKLTALTKAQFQLRSQEQHQAGIIAKLKMDNRALEEKVSTAQTNLAEAHFGFANMLKLEHEKGDDNKMKIEQLQAQNLTLTNELERKVADVQILKNKIEQLQAQNLTLTNELEGKVADFETMQNKIDQLEKQNSELESQRKELEDDLKTQLADKNNLTISLQHMLDSNLGKPETDQENANILQRELNQLKEELANQKYVYEQEKQEMEIRHEKQEFEIFNLDRQLRNFTQEEKALAISKTIQSTLVENAQIETFKKEIENEEKPVQIKIEMKSNSKLVQLSECLDKEMKSANKQSPETCDEDESTDSDLEVVWESFPRSRISEATKSLDGSSTDGTVTTLEERSHDGTMTLENIFHDSSHGEDSETDCDIGVDGIFGDDKIEETRKTRKKKRVSFPNQMQSKYFRTHK